MDLKRLVRSPLGVTAIAIAVIGAVVILTVFQPQKLFIDERVDEALPSATPTSTTNASASPPGSPSPSAAGREILASGAFRSLAHHGSGDALAIRLADGHRVLRLEDLDVENGPDLFVYLSTAPADVADEDDFDDDFVNLGRLKGNKGNQNYTLAASVDLARYRTVVIWCRRFTTAFAAAPLT